MATTASLRRRRCPSRWGSCPYSRGLRSAHGQAPLGDPAIAIGVAVEPMVPAWGTPPRAQRASKQVSVGATSAFASCGQAVAYALACFVPEPVPTGSVIASAGSG
jgi:hypothetical protein